LHNHAVTQESENSIPRNVVIRQVRRLLPGCPEALYLEEASLGPLIPGSPAEELPRRGRPRREDEALIDALRLWPKHSLRELAAQYGVKKSTLHDRIQEQKENMQMSSLVEVSATGTHPSHPSSGDHRRMGEERKG